MGTPLRQLVAKCLESQPERPLTASEIAQWIMRQCPGWCSRKKAAASREYTDEQLLGQVTREIYSQRPSILKAHPQIHELPENPIRLVWRHCQDTKDLCSVGDTHKNISEEPAPFMEYDLYPIVSEFLREAFSVYSKRIDERKSSNSLGKNRNKWLHPDIVGIEDLAGDWHREVKHLVKESSGRRARLYAFEVKRSLNIANTRESYFQAVSNSSWANFGYLVCADVCGSATMGELRMLSALHGIGLMKVNAENPSEWAILIPARERQEVDWATCSRIASENSDFNEFVRLVRQFYQTGDLRAKDWD